MVGDIFVLPLSENSHGRFNYVSRKPNDGFIDIFPKADTRIVENYCTRDSRETFVTFLRMILHGHFLVIKGGLISL